jgi:hypothetical protein
LIADHVLVAVLKIVVWLTSLTLKGLLKPPLMRNDTPSLSGTITSNPQAVVSKSLLCVTFVQDGVLREKSAETSIDQVSD